MTQYHKIQTCFKRDESGRITGDWSLPEFEFLRGVEWEFTEKVDGTNIRVMWDGSGVTFGGKTDNAQMPVFLLYKLQELFEGTVKKRLFREKFGEAEVCLYGEGYGAKIQSGGNYIPDGVDFVLFDVRVGDWWLKREDVEEIAKYFGIRSVPVIGSGTLDDMIEKVKGGFKSQWGDFMAEGIVARPKVELVARNGERIITKLKHKDFK